MVPTLSTAPPRLGTSGGPQPPGPWLPPLHAWAAAPSLGGRRWTSRPVGTEAGVSGQAPPRPRASGGGPHRSLENTAELTPRRQMPLRPPGHAATQGAGGGAGAGQGHPGRLSHSCCPPPPPRKTGSPDRRLDSQLGHMSRFWARSPAGSRVLRCHLSERDEVTRRLSLRCGHKQPVSARTG